MTIPQKCLIFAKVYRGRQ